MPVADNFFAVASISDFDGVWGMASKHHVVAFRGECTHSTARRLGLSIFFSHKQLMSIFLFSRKQSPLLVPGMDCYCKEESKQELLTFLDAHDPELAREFRASCYPRESPHRWPDILSKMQWRGSAASKKKALGNLAGSMKMMSSGGSGGAAAAQQEATSQQEVRENIYRGCTPLDRFNAEQNLECMISADEYYSKQKLEPPGSQASWNARDQHMAMTLQRIKEHSEELFPDMGPDGGWFAGRGSDRKALGVTGQVGSFVRGASMSAMWRWKNRSTRRIT